MKESGLVTKQALDEVSHQVSKLSQLETMGDRAKSSISVQTGLLNEKLVSARKMGATEMDLARTILPVKTEFSVDWGLWFLSQLSKTNQVEDAKTVTGMLKNLGVSEKRIQVASGERVI